MTDSYKFTPNPPVLYRNLEDDVSAILAACVQLGYHYYLYGGMVMQIEVANYTIGAQRYFISFNLHNDARQHFHEASGNSKVFNADRDENAFKWFLAEMLENVKPKQSRDY